MTTKRSTLEWKMIVCSGGMSMKRRRRKVSYVL